MSSNNIVITPEEKVIINETYDEFIKNLNSNFESFSYNIKDYIKQFFTEIPVLLISLHIQKIIKIEPLFIEIIARNIVNDFDTILKLQNNKELEKYKNEKCKENIINIISKDDKIINDTNLIDKIKTQICSIGEKYIYNQLYYKNIIHKGTLFLYKNNKNFVKEKSKIIDLLYEYYRKLKLDNLFDYKPIINKIINSFLAYILLFGINKFEEYMNMHNLQTGGRRRTTKRSTKRTTKKTTKKSKKKSRKSSKKKNEKIIFLLY